MTKKIKAAKTAPVQETPAEKSNKWGWLYTTITVLVGVAAAMLILGLATRGLSTYIKGMTDSARTTASIVGVAFLAFCVASLVKLAKR